MLYCIITSENFFKHAFLCAIIKHCASLWFTTFLYLSCIRLVVPKTVQFLSEMSAVLNWKYWITVQTQLSFGLKITPWRNECEMLLCNQPPRPNQFPTFGGTGKWVLVKMQWCSTGEEQRQIWLVSHTGLIVHVWQVKLCSLSTTQHQLLCGLLSVTVLWHCWLGSRKDIQPVKTEWWGAGVVNYLSGARCRLAYGPADATASHCLLLQ